MPSEGRQEIIVIVNKYCKCSENSNFSENKKKGIFLENKKK